MEEWETGAPPRAYDGPYWRARVPVSKRRAELRRTREDERFDDFEIRQEWWIGDALPDAMVVHRELAGVPKVEVVGQSKEKWKSCSGTPSPRSESISQAYPGTSFRLFRTKRKQIGVVARHRRPSSVMIHLWTDTPWNGSATTS